jgi:addiction module HigA family antidote
MKPKNGMRPIHPGEILNEEFLLPLEMSANKLAAAINVPTNRLTAIIKGQRAVTADTALRLAKGFNTTPEFWMNLQKTFELRTAEQDKATGLALKNIKPVTERRQDEATQNDEGPSRVLGAGHGIRNRGSAKH